MAVYSRVFIEQIDDVPDDYVYTYVGLFFGIICAGVVHCVGTAMAATQAAKTLHIKMLRNITAAPMRYVA